MSERGMKKWAPYKSLNEQDKYLKRLHENNNKVDKPILSSDEAEEINDVLVNYHNEELAITYFRNNQIVTIISYIKKIDSINKKIVLLERKTINFNEIIKLERTR